jgi:AGCS family alanine or glycine:cation symporter
MAAFNGLVWGIPLVALLLGSGLFFLIYSRLAPLRYLPHAISLVRGKHNESNAKGQWTHAQALSTALAGTIGLGNIAGVAVAVKLGGPGAVLWMWATAVVGIGTKFFTGTLSVMYRGIDRYGETRGGPMYIITEGLGPRFKPLAYLFCIAGLVGCLPALQINQVVETTENLLLAPMGIDSAYSALVMGVVSAVLVGMVIFGGTARLGSASLTMVPAMCTVYLLAVVGILISNIQALPSAFASIFLEALNPSAAITGGFMGVLLIGVKRGLFSNEAGIGTEVLAHGAAKTSQPINEGLVAMLGPIIDTLLVCSATALAILVTQVANTSDATGATLTAAAFAVTYGSGGQYLLLCIVLVFGFSTMTSYWFYGSQCAAWLGGRDLEKAYKYIYLGSLIGLAFVPLHAALNLIDGMYALMAIPTLTATLILSPKVMAAFKLYRQN